MTASRLPATHRAAVGSGASRGAAQPVPPGRGPGGMWWVAWRQHQIQVLIALVVMVLVAVAVLVFQLVLVARLHAAGCTVLTDPNRCNSMAAMNAFDQNTWHLLRGVLVATPVVLGVFLGAPMFPREFEQRTHVLALTQSVGRRRWWATKVTVAGVPLLAGLLGLGFLQQWCDATTWFTGRAALDDGTFQVRSIVPAAFGLLAFAIAVTAGLFIRSVTAALVAALVVAGAGVIVMAFPLRPHLLPATRLATPITEVQPAPGAVTVYNDAMRGSWFLGSGTLDASGHVVQFDQNRCTLPPAPQDQGATTVTIGGGVMAVGSDDPAYDQAVTKAYAACQREQGIVASYTDYLPAAMLWPLRGVVTGICVLLAALILALGAWHLRAAPRSVR